ncbi:hypothetical protein ACQP2U_42370 (plasmid) [Nocardia sp. CA-084685]|uniref:hypothetical protein n=1 Tax=Nocardia sp. CA-084685 TaxID=3239970 RepID=UPI003D96AD5B
MDNATVTDAHNQTGDEDPAVPPRPANPNTRYHTRKARDAEARAAHAAASRQWRRALAAAAFNRDDQKRLLNAIRNGTTVANAARDLGLTHQAIYKRASWDTRFGNQLERALAETCPAGTHCGKPSGARFYHGHCHACRIAKRHPTTE